MDAKQKLVGDRPGAESGDGIREDLSSFFHTAVRQLDVEESKFNIIAETLFILFLEEFGGSQVYVPFGATRYREGKWEEYYRKYKGEIYSAGEIADIQGCSKKTVFVRFRLITESERLTGSAKLAPSLQTEKQRILGGVGAGRSKTSMRKFADFFHKAVRQLDIEERKFDTIAEQLLRILLVNFGGSCWYFPLLNRLETDDGWKECFIKYKSGIYSIEKIAKLMNVTQRHVYRKLKAMTERERQARRQNAEAAPSFRSK